MSGGGLLQCSKVERFIMELSQVTFSFFIKTRKNIIVDILSRDAKKIYYHVMNWLIEDAKIRPLSNFRD